MTKDAAFLAAPHQHRWSLLLVGFSSHAANICCSNLVQLYVIHQLNQSASEFTANVFALRLVAVLAIVLVFAPLGSLFSPASALRYSAFATAAAVAAMAIAPYNLLRYLSAFGCATVSLCFVFINTLVQQATRKDPAMKVRVNMEYRSIASAAKMLFPFVTTNVLVVYFASGYAVAFLICSTIMTAAAFLLDPRFRLLATPSSSPSTSTSTSTSTNGTNTDNGAISGDNKGAAGQEDEQSAVQASGPRR